MPKKIRLREKDVIKLSAILDIPSEYIQELLSKNIIDDMGARKCLILADWRKVKKTNRYATRQIINALMNEYQVSRATVQSVIYAKEKSLYWCSECEKKIPKAEHKRNEGLCDQCVSSSIEL